jgi:hypothetical protein
MQKILLTCCFFLCSCRILENNKTYGITDFPSKPPLTQYSTPPVKEKIKDDFLVSGEMIVNSTLLLDYYKRVEVWKQKHSVK